MTRQQNQETNILRLGLDSSSQAEPLLWGFQEVAIRSWARRVGAHLCGGPRLHGESRWAVFVPLGGVVRSRSCVMHRQFISTLSHNLPRIRMASAWTRENQKKKRITTWRITSLTVLGAAFQ